MPHADMTQSTMKKDYSSAPSRKHMIGEGIPSPRPRTRGSDVFFNRIIFKRK
jgi:hypothetical protein